MSITFKSSEHVLYISSFEKVKLLFHFSLLFAIAFFSVGKQLMLIKENVAEEAPARHNIELLNLVLLWTEVRIGASLPKLLYLSN